MLALLNKIVSFIKGSTNNKFENIQSDILLCLGKSLKDKELLYFIQKYDIEKEDKYNTRFFNCYNSFLQFQNSDQHAQIINEINVVNNSVWLPYHLSKRDTLKTITNKLGEPDICDYKFNSLIYFDKLISISFQDVKDDNSNMIMLTFNSRYKIKPSIEDLKIRNEYNEKYLRDLQDKSFGYNSQWLIIKSFDLEKVSNLFNAIELVSWRDGFELSMFHNTSGVFVAEIENHGVLVYGWSLPGIGQNMSFYENLSVVFGEITYFVCDLKSPFGWALLKNGKVDRAYSEEYFEKIVNIGHEIAVEMASLTKRVELLNENEPYNSDQDIKRNYRLFMAELVLSIAAEWSFDPRNMSGLHLREQVFINREYR